MGYLFLAGLSAAGFLASLVCHIMGWMLIEPPLGKAVFLLHAGIFVVWFPLVIFANQTKPSKEGGNMAHLIAELPTWMRVAGGFLVFYTIINFIYFLICTSKYPKNGVPFLLELRGFSGHWMLFYGFALAGFVALSRLARKRRSDQTVA